MNRLSENNYKLFEKRLLALRPLEYYEGVKLTKKYLSEAIKNKNKEDEAIVYYLTGLLSRYSEKHKAALRYYFKAIKILKAVNSGWWEASVNHAIGHCYFLTGEAKKSIPYYNCCYEYYVKTKDLFKQAIILMNTGAANGYTGSNDIRLNCYKKASGIFFRLKMKYDYAVSLNNIAMVYNDINDPQNALKYLKESTKIFLKLGDKEKICGNYSNLGETYFLLKENRQALKYFRLAYNNLAEGMLSEISIPVVMNLGRIYISLRKYKSAEKYLYEVIDKSIKTKNRFREMQAFKYLGEVYMLLKKHRESVKCFEKALSVSRKSKAKTEMYDIHERIALLMSKTGNYKEAYHHYKLYHKIFTGVFNFESDRRTKELKTTFEKEKAEKDTEIFRLKNLELKREIESKEKELTNAANYIVQKNDLLSSAFGELKDIIISSETDLSDKNKLIRELELIERKKQLSAELVDFEKNLNKINISFIDKLSKKYPLLTRIELKICSMMKINLGTKEIAKMLSLSHRTVESHRYHIIHKLKLSKGKSLAQFIHTIG